MATPTGGVIVAGHICLDLIPTLTGPANIQPGHLAKIGPALISLGGAVANTGIALHKLGMPARLMGKIGDDAFGQIVLNLLRQSGPALADDMVVQAGEITSYSVVVSPPGQDRTFWHCTGANDTFAASDIPYDDLAGSRFFHFGYPPIMARMFSRDGAELAEMLRNVHDRGLAVGLDFAQPDPESEAGRIRWEPLLQQVLPHTDVVFPSLDELLFMLDRETFDARRGHSQAVDLQILRRLSDRLLKMKTAVVVIKLGESGLYVRTSRDGDRIADFCQRLSLPVDGWRDRELYAPCFRAGEVVGTTGAGDCTIAGFIAALLRGEDVDGAAQSAVAVGAFSVEAADATGGIRPWAHVQSRIAAGWPRGPVGISLAGQKHTPRPDGAITFD